MRKYAFITAIVLCAWIGGSSYYYMCKVRHHCLPTSTELMAEKKHSLDELKNDSDTPSELMADTTALTNTEPVDTSQNENALDSIILDSNIPQEEKVEKVREYVKKEAEADRSVFFDFNKKTTTLSKEDYDYIGRLFFLLKNDKAIKIRIEGHSDNKGSEQIKYQVALRRAQFLRKMLQSKGISSKRITIKSQSDKMPVASNDTEEGRTKNRRAQILIINQ